MIPGTTYIRTWYIQHFLFFIFRLMRYTDVCFFSLSGLCTTFYDNRYLVRIMYQIRIYVWYVRYVPDTYVPGISQQKSIRTYVMFRPWTHTSDDSYIYQLSLVVATATLSFLVIHTLRVPYGRYILVSSPTKKKSTNSYYDEQLINWFHPPIPYVHTSILMYVG